MKKRKAALSTGVEEKRMATEDLFREAADGDGYAPLAGEDASSADVSSGGDVGAAVAVSRSVGRKHAMQMLLTGDMMGAEEARMREHYSTRRLAVAEQSIRLLHRDSMALRVKAMVDRSREKALRRAFSKMCEHSRRSLRAKALLSATRGAERSRRTAAARWLQSMLFSQRMRNLLRGTAIICLVAQRPFEQHVHATEDRCHECRGKRAGIAECTAAQGTQEGGDRSKRRHRAGQPPSGQPDISHRARRSPCPPH